MANTTVRKTNTKTTETVDKTDTNLKDIENITKENAELKNQIEQIQNQMNALLQQFAMLNLNNSVNNQDKDIEVVSLVDATLLISTTGRSDGKIYEFKKQFESQPIPVGDLKEIVRAMPRTARDGYFYILDSDFVRENGLSSSYRNILNDTEMANIFNLNSVDFVETYKKVSDAQRKVIENMLINKRLMGEEVDANIMLGLQKVTNRNYMEIEPLENVKEG